jgi:hypothetical protein
MAYFFGVDFLFVDNSDLVTIKPQLPAWHKIIGALKGSAKSDSAADSLLRKRSPRFD